MGGRRRERATPAPHISLFLLNGKTVSTPVLSDIGELGTISFTGNSNGGVPTGVITYTPNDETNAVFYSPQVPGSPFIQCAKRPSCPDQMAVRWTTASRGSIWFEMMIESLYPGRTSAPLVTTVHGSFADFVVGYAYYLQIVTSNVAGAMSISG